MVGGSGGSGDCAVKCLEEGAERGVDLFEEGGDERGELLGAQRLGVVALPDDKLFETGELVAEMRERSAKVSGYGEENRTRSKRSC